MLPERSRKNSIRRFCGSNQIRTKKKLITDRRKTKKNARDKTEKSKIKLFDKERRNSFTFDVAHPPPSFTLGPDRRDREQAKKEES